MPVGNEIKLKLETDNRFSTDGTAAQIVLTFSAIDTTVGNTFTLEYGEVSLQFWLATAPDGSGTQIRKATIGQPVNYWMLQVAEDLARNYYLQRDFLFATDETALTITLTAKETGTGYSAASDFNNVSGLVISATAGVDPVARDNYELICVTEILDGSVYEKLGEDRLTPDTANQATFYLQGLLAPQLTAEFTWPEIVNAHSAARANHIRQYRLIYAETYDDVVKQLSAAAVYYACLGGLDYKMIAGLDGSTWGMLDYITSYKAWLTWRPVSKYINLTQPEKLYFLVYNNISLIRLKIKIYYTDGTNSGSQTLATVSPVTRYSVYEFMVGYGVIDFAKFSAKTVSSYEIWLEDGSAAVQTQTMTFVIDPKTYRHERVFLFKNSFGAFETFRATGRKTHMNELERLLLDKSDREINLTEVYAAFEQQTFTINSGWISRDTKNWLRELFLSGEVYEILNGYKFPIIITTDKNDLFDDDNYMYDIKLDYKYNFKDKYFSGEPARQALLAETGEILKSEDGQSLYA